ncbi:MAG: hypothetical protein VXZ73_02135 [Pseudomonadota bacterium]|nr:hypothetical protein [Pseudomonadota bacterium]
MTRSYSKILLANKWSCIALLQLCVVSIQAQSVCSVSEPGYGLLAVFNRILSDFCSIADLLGALSYVAGVAFSVASVFKFKQHRDSPTQVPIGFPFIYLAAAVGLIFMPQLLGEGATTFFSSIDESYRGAFVDPSVWSS